MFTDQQFITLLAALHKIKFGGVSTEEESVQFAVDMVKTVDRELLNRKVADQKAAVSKTDVEGIMKDGQG